MVDSIQPSDPRRISPASTDRADTPKSSSKGSTPPELSGAPQSDEVVISQLGQDVQLVKENLAQTDAARAARLQGLADQIKKGEYHVSTDQIAEKLLDDSRHEES